jgi:hypothetical protein
VKSHTGAKIKRQADFEKEKKRKKKKKEREKRPAERN